MKKRLAELMMQLVVLVVFMGIICGCAYVESHYTRKDCTVVETQGYVVTVEDRCGYTWDYEVEGEAPSVGTVVDIHMFTNNTDSYIYDDVVVDVTVH